MSKKSTIKSETDWARVDAMRDEDIDYSDIPEITAEMWARSVPFVATLPKKSVSLRLDPDIVEWFKGQGPRYQTRINAVLRGFVDQQKKPPRAKRSRR